MIKKRLIDVIAVLFIVLFVYTGVSKFLDFEYFKLTIEQANILKPIAGFVQWIVPLSEIAVAVLLMTKKFRLIGLYASFLLMLGFTAYVGGILRFSKQLPCSCGGIIQEMSWMQHLIFNIVFTALAAVAIWIEKHSDTKKANLTAPIFQ